MNKRITILIFALTFSISALSQLLVHPKKNDFKGKYKHRPSKTVFPKQIGDFKLIEVYAFDTKKRNIGVTYSSEDNYSKTEFTIYIYPGGDGIEGRLRSEFKEAIISTKNERKEGTDYYQLPVRYEDSNYICNGFKMSFTDKSDNYCQLSLYESGIWFLKLSLVTNSKTLNVLDLENEIIKTINPSRLTGLYPLNIVAESYYWHELIYDTYLLNATIAAAHKKADWAKKNISRKERMSGFPDIYLEMHLESLKIFHDTLRIQNPPDTLFSRQYLEELSDIIDSGYLGEFIVDQYDNILIVPDNYSFDFPGYNKWKKENELFINLNKVYYFVIYDTE